MPTEFIIALMNADFEYELMQERLAEYQAENK